MGRVFLKPGIFLLALLMIVGTAGNALATLSTYTNFNGTGDTVVYDGSRYWYYDLEDTDNMDYAYLTATFIPGLNSSSSYAGINNWYLASQADMGLLLGNALADIASAFGKSEDGYLYDFWAGRYDEEVSDKHSTFYISKYLLGGYDSAYGDLSDGTESDRFGAWITTPAPVPEPATMLLLGTGLVGLAGARRKMKNLN